MPDSPFRGLLSPLLSPLVGKGEKRKGSGHVK